MTKATKKEMGGERKTCGPGSTIGTAGLGRYLWPFLRARWRYVLSNFGMLAARPPEFRTNLMADIAAAHRAALRQSGGMRLCEAQRSRCAARGLHVDRFDGRSTYTQFQHHRPYRPWENDPFGPAPAPHRHHHHPRNAGSIAGFDGPGKGTGHHDQSAPGDDALPGQGRPDLRAESH